MPSLPSIVILLGALLSAAGAFWSNHRAEQEKVNSAESRSRFETELRKKSEEISELNKTIAARADEIAELNKKIAASLTGGDGFCQVLFGEMIKGSYGMVVENNGDYPMYDVSIRVTDADVIHRTLHDGEQEDLFRKILEDSAVVQVGTVPAHQTQMRPSGFELFKDSSNFSIFISARNGTFTQITKRRKVSGEFVRAVRITRDQDGKILHEQVDPKFPRNSKGQVDWK